MVSDGVRKQFWKCSNSKFLGSIQYVYGVQYFFFDLLLYGILLKFMVKMLIILVKVKRVSIFQEFESNISDVWDVGEDDDEFLVMVVESLNFEVVMEMVNWVLCNYSQWQGWFMLQERLEFQQKFRFEVELFLFFSGDFWLVKFVSESYIFCFVESVSDVVFLQRFQFFLYVVIVMLGGIFDFSIFSSLVLSEREVFWFDKFKQLFVGFNIDFEELWKLSWFGIFKLVCLMMWKFFLIFERILFIWVICYFVSGYVQGINDFVIFFFVVFICEYIEVEEVDMVDVFGVFVEVLCNIEVDIYWCMSKLLDGIQDNYIFV